MKRTIILLITALLSAPFMLTCGDILEEAPESVASTGAIAISGIEATPSADSATITFATDVASTHLIEYGTTSGAYTASTLESSAEETSHSETITGLTAETTYYYRIKVFNSVYEDSASAEQTFTTTAEAGVTHPTLAEKLRGIWIVGGLSGSGIATVVAQVDLYDPDTDTWYPSVTDILYPVSFASVTSVNGNIYVIGGFRNDGSVSVFVQEYNISSDTWTSKNITVTPKANIYGVVSDNKIYILGGSTSTASAGWGGTRDTQRYNPASDSWASLLATTLPANGTERFTVSHNGIIYHMGGRITNATTPSVTNEGYICNSNTNSTTEIDLSPARTGIAGGVYQYTDDTVRIFIAGGVTTSGLTACNGNYILQGTSAITAQDYFQYLSNPFVTGSWIPSVSLPLIRAFGSATIKEKYFYFFGGIQTISIFSSKTYCILLDPLATAWDETKSDMPIARYGHAAVTINQ